MLGGEKNKKIKSDNPTIKRTLFLLKWIFLGFDM